VDSVSDMLSAESRTAKARCVIDNSQALLRGEMFAKIAIISAKRGSSVLIPKEAVLDESGKKIAFLPCNECKEAVGKGPMGCGLFDKTEITTGPVHGNNIEILSGVTPGQYVVTTGAYQLKTALGSGSIQAGCTDH
jgi:cobalt-zinc-cadmium efflux system membrane fusion protein